MDDEQYKARVATAVFNAIFEAGRTPSGDVNVDMVEAIDAMTDAIVSFIVGVSAAVGQHDKEMVAKEIDGMSEQVSVKLADLAAAIRDGSLRTVPVERPTLRVVT